MSRTKRCLALALALVLCALCCASGAEVLYQQGDKGKKIQAIKDRMLELGYYTKAPSNSKFNEDMVKRVKKLQKVNGLKQTGTIDEALYTLLFSDAVLRADGTPAGIDTADARKTAKPTKTPKPTATPTTRAKRTAAPAPTLEPTETPQPTATPILPQTVRYAQGSDDPRVKQIKQRLYELGYYAAPPEDAVYDQTMTDMVKTLQKNNGLQPTGEINQALFALLFSDRVVPQSAPRVEAVSLETVMRYIPALTPVNGTDYLIIRPRGGNFKGVVTADGQQILPCEYANLEYVNYGFYRAFEDSQTVNGKAIVHTDRGLVSDYCYGAVIAYNGHWAAGYVLAEATEEAYDTAMGGRYYRIARCDLYYVDEDPAQTAFVGSVGEYQFQSAAARGQYIAVQTRDGKITLYNRQMQALNYAMAKTTDAVYGIRNLAITDLATGQTVLEGYSEVREVPNVRGLWLSADVYHWTGRKLYTLLDEHLNTVFNDENYTVNAATPQYITISGADRRVGLYSIAQQQVVVPAEYDKVIANNTTVDEYIANGYVMVERAGLRGFVDTRTGAVSCDLRYDPTDLKRIGCVMYYQTEEGFQLIAADGVETFVQAEALNCRGDGRLLVVRRNGYYGVIDWHGNEVLPFIYKWNIAITDNSQYLIRTGTGMELDRIVYAGGAQ